MYIYAPKNLPTTISAKYVGTWPTNGAVVGNNEAKNSSKTVFSDTLNQEKWCEGEIVFRGRTSAVDI